MAFSTSRIHLYESYVSPLVAAADVVVRKKVRHRPLQELGIKLVADVVDYDNRGLSDERFFCRIEAENRSGECFGLLDTGEHDIFDDISESRGVDAI